jgi:hypothetical protein
VRGGVARGKAAMGKILVGTTSWTEKTRAYIQELRTRAALLQEFANHEGRPTAPTLASLPPVIGRPTATQRDRRDSRSAASHAIRDNDIRHGVETNSH